MKIEELNRILVDFLRSYLPAYLDPIDWSKAIYIDYPRPDATFPRISVSQAGHSTDPGGIGELGPEGIGEYQHTSYDIDIWVQKGNAFQIDPLPAGKHAGTALRDRIGDDVIQALMNGKKWLKDNKKIFDLDIVSTLTIPYMDAYEIFRRTITIRVFYYRIKTNSP
jgi:hypothetical protein